MALTTDVIPLIQDLKSIFMKVYESGISEGVSSDKIIKDMSMEMGDAIHTYMKSASVITTDIINPGQNAAGPFGVGSYVSPGTASGTGNISFKPQDVMTLKNDILKLFMNVRDQGIIAGVNSDTIIARIASEMKTAIHGFALKAEVQTNIILPGGVPVIGYLTTTPPPVPLPSVSGPGKGTGTGVLL